MKLTAALLFLFVSFFSSEIEEEKITWNASQKLTWKDFKGTPEGAEAFVASTNSGVSFGFSYTEENGVGSVETTIASNFYPNLSWYRPENVSPYILAHEQTHFDITEIHARKLRMKLDKLAHDRTFRDKASAIYNAMEAERREMQQAYDGETDHSNVEEAEFRWRAFVKKELEIYQAWK